MQLIRPPAVAEQTYSISIRRTAATTPTLDDLEQAGVFSRTKSAGRAASWPLPPVLFWWCRRLWHSGRAWTREDTIFGPLLHQGQNYDTAGIDSGIGIGPALQRCRIYSIPEPSG